MGKKKKRGSKMARFYKLLKTNLSLTSKKLNKKLSLSINSKTAKKDDVSWSPPNLDANSPSPIFGGSLGGLMNKAKYEEFYVITWNAKKEKIFEMPTGGAAIMRQGPNLLKLARKEQCLALTTRLRTKFKTNACFYRVLPSGEVQYLHPADGVYPEKVNKGRKGSNQNMRRIGQNAQPAVLKFSSKGVTRPFEE